MRHTCWSTIGRGKKVESGHHGCLSGTASLVLFCRRYDTLPASNWRLWIQSRLICKSWGWLKRSCCSSSICKRGEMASGSGGVRTTSRIDPPVMSHQQERPTKALEVTLGTTSLYRRHHNPATLALPTKNNTTHPSQLHYRSCQILRCIRRCAAPCAKPTSLPRQMIQTLCRFQSPTQTAHTSAWSLFKMSILPPKALPKTIISIAGAVHAPRLRKTCSTGIAYSGTSSAAFGTRRDPVLARLDLLSL